VLKMSNNKISTLDQVKQLSVLDNLVQLDIEGNAVCDIAGYREKVFEALPKLFALDGQDRDGGSIISEDGSDYGEEGEFD